jgi:hypothetical protein
MKRSLTGICGCLILISFFAILSACNPPDPPDDPPVDPPAGDCDRACLLGVLDGYLDALAANDPSRLQTASTLKYTDNGVAARLGEGLWTTATSIDDQKRLDFADPQLGNVASQVVVNEGGGGCGDSSAVIYQVRLKVAQNRITEIESMTVRRSGAANGFFNVENMAPQPVFNQAIPAGQRMSRAELKTVIDLYMDYLEGTRTGAQVPFDADCARYENGVVTANGISAFEAQSMWQFDVTRRYLVIDEAAGIVWGMFPFSQTERALVVGEAFKVIDGKIMMIQAVMARIPSKAWD